MTSNDFGPRIPEAMEAVNNEFHFSAAFQAGDQLIISGQTGVDAHGEVPTRRDEEAQVAFERLGEILKHSNLSFRDVACITSYHVGDASDIHDWFAPVKDRYLAEVWPAWTVVGVQSLADKNARLEITAIAHFKAQR